METRQAWRSHAHAAIFGYPPDEVQQWSFNDFQRHVYPEDKAWVDRSIREGTQAGTGWGFECRILRKDQSLRWVAIRSAPIPGSSTPCRRVRGIVMDITERKIAEMAAQESDRRFAWMANSAPVLIWTAGVDKLCDFFNQPWLAFTGRTIEQELGNGWAEGVHPGDMDQCLKTYLSHFDARLPFRMEYRLRRHDGVYRWILDHGVPRFLPDGSFIGYIGSCIDITDQRLDQENAQDAARSATLLQQSLQQLTAQQRIILDTSPLGIGLVRNRELVWSNPAHQSLFGYDEAESVGMPTAKLYANESDYRRLGMEGYETLRRGETYKTEVRLRKKDGAVFWCQVTGKSVNPADPEGSSIWLLADIEAVRQAEAQFRLQSEMLSHMGEGVVLVSGRSTRIVHTNPMFDRMLGYAEGELNGQPVSIVNEPGDSSQEEIAKRIFAELNRHGHWEGEIANRRKDGTSIICHASVSRFQHHELGEVWMSVHTDVTREKQLQRALREAKERYDALVENVPCGVQVVRLRPNGTYHFDFVSPRTAQLIGVPLEELQRDATLWMRNAWPEDAAKAAQENARCIATKEPYTWEGRFTVAGTVRWLRFEGRPTGQNDGDFLWNAVVHDITEQKGLEAAQREAQKLAALGHFAGGMAHEFNNILASMLMTIGLAQHDEAPASIVESLGDLEKSCVRAGGLIKQLLAFSQKSVLRPQQFVLNDFLASRLPSLQANLGPGCRVELTDCPQALSVSGDPALLEQAVRNLCENACDAMRDGGLVRIGLEAVEVDAERCQRNAEARPGRFACLSVSDQGCGMDAKTRLRLFEPFFTTKEVGRGTGLGLATVRGIIRQHQGWVEVESEVGRGSCFRLHLPLARAVDQTSVPRAASPAPTGAIATILLAEDYPGLRTIVSRILKRSGYRVFEAQDAAAAQKLWEAHGDEIDLLLSDVVMPGAESGYELAQRLIHQRPGLKVILTSGYNTTLEDQPAELRDRMVYLAKPVPSELLLQTIKRSLQPAP